MENYQTLLNEEEAALKQQQKVANEVANEVAENELLEEFDLESDEDDNYNIEEVTLAVAEAVENAEGESTGNGNGNNKGVIGASGGSLGNNAPINEQSIAVAHDYLTGKVADAQKDVNAFKGAKLTTAKTLQSKLDAYKKAAENVEKAVVDANKAGVALAANNIGSDGKSEISNVDINNINVDGSFVVAIDSSITINIAADGKVDYNKYTTTTGEDGSATTETTDTEAAFKALKGNADFLKSLDKIHTSLLAVPTAEEAVQKAVAPLLAAEGYSLVKFEANTASVQDGKKQPWSELPWGANGALDSSKLTGTIGDSGNAGLALVKDDAVVNFSNVTLYTVAGTLDGNTGKINNAADLNKFTTGLTNIADVTIALNDLSGAKEDLDAFNKAVADWKEVVSLQEQLEAEADNVEDAAEAVEKAEEAFEEEYEVHLVKADDGVATGAVYDEDEEDQLADLFVFQKGLKEVDNFDGNDLLYFGQSPDGSAYNLVVLGKNEAITDDVGSINGFDIFAVQDGANTKLYIEEKVFAGNGSTKADLIEVELVGVTAADLTFDNGFLTFGA